jgi:hypothetical protein
MHYFIFVFGGNKMVQKGIKELTHVKDYCVMSAMSLLIGAINVNM